MTRPEMEWKAMRDRLHFFQGVRGTLFMVSCSRQRWRWSGMRHQRRDGRDVHSSLSG